MKRLGTRVNLIPVIAKADTLTQSDLFTFKQRVCLPFNAPLYRHLNDHVAQIRDVITAQNIRIYQPPIEVDDEASAEHARILAEAMPFSIIGSTEDVQTPDGRVTKGREYLWGVAEGGPSPYICLPFCPVDAFLQWRMRTTATSASCARCSSAHSCSTLFRLPRRVTMRTTANSRWRLASMVNAKSRSSTTPSSKKKRNNFAGGSPSRSRPRSLGSGNGNNT
jgi:Septin